MYLVANVLVAVLILGQFIQRRHIVAQVAYDAI